MEHIQYCNDSIEHLKSVIPTCYANDIRLAAESLEADFSTAAILEGEIDIELQKEIIELIDKARSAIPVNANALFNQRMTETIRKVQDPELDIDE